MTQDKPKQPSTPSPAKRSAHRLSRRELGASLLIPIALGLLIFLVGAVVAWLAPWAFNTSITVLIGLGLLAYLVYYTRKASWRLRLTAIILAVPALVGITLGLINGSARDTLIGVGVTLLLLVLQRILSTPISYRAALRAFRQGDSQQALELINKSIGARPDFWESYQLRALIYLSQMRLAPAERDAQKALSLRPDAHPLYNTLGQIYLAEERFEEAAEAYGKALELAPSYALYAYHLGLSQYRQEAYRAAAESFAAATQGTLPLDEYDLQASYYLGRCLEALGEPEAAQKAYEQMAIFHASLKPLKRQVDNQPQYPHMARLHADVADIEQRLGQIETASAAQN